MIIEVCCGSYEDALCAYHAKAQRIELNSALALGGLTPSVASLRLVKSSTPLEVACMVRPRKGGFRYLETEVEQMLAEAKDLLEAGADAIVFGFLNEDGTIDEYHTIKMMRVIRQYPGRKAVFHRAFDVVPDVDEAINTLIKLGVNRILTGGLAATAMEGIDMIRYLQDTYGSQIEILAGCGVNKDNVRELAERTGVTQIHGSFSKRDKDLTATRNGVDFGSGGLEHTDKHHVEAVLAQFR